MRWFNVAALLFWLTTMGWLFTEKILPSLDVGEPPGYGMRDTPVRWELFINGDPLGWATSEARLDEDGVVQYDDHVHLDRLPLREIAPAWLLSSLDLQLSDTWMDVRSMSQADPLGRLIGFRSTVALGYLENVATIEGKADDGRLDLTVRAAGMVHKKTIPLPAENNIDGALSPAVNLGRLRVGQHWTVPVYSPLGPPTAPVEILYAHVEREEPIIWNGHIVKTSLVIYANEPAGSDVGYGNWHARAWVAADGRVLKQQIAVVNAYVTFVRQPADVAVETFQRAAAGAN